MYLEKIVVINYIFYLAIIYYLLFRMINFNVNSVLVTLGY